MVESGGSNADTAPTPVAQLSLPPTFIADHCLRTLFYQGPLSPVELARHWHVPADIGLQIVDALKAEGAVHPEALQTSFGGHSRVELTALGREMVSTARERTWYAGPLPVSVSEFTRRMETPRGAAVSRSVMREALAAHHLDETIADGIGQAMSGGATVTVAGLTVEEQPSVAAAIGSVFTGETLLPHALYAAGAVVRLFDARYHRPASLGSDITDGMNVLRSGAAEQWTAIAEPIVTLKGGIVASELLPAYDAEARFYIAPAPLVASGGMLAILHADLADADALTTLARLWLVPGRSGTGMLVLRTGERVELPWRASTLLLSTFHLSVTTLVSGHLIDASSLHREALRGFLAEHLRRVELPDGLVELAADTLERTGAPTRVMAAAVAQYVRSRAAYEAHEFRATPTILEEAVDTAARDVAVADPKLRLVS